KAELLEWIGLLCEHDYCTIREKAEIDRIPLWKMGFWNVLSEVMNHYAVLKLRDWASFYHLLPENPNAAEWVIFWLRGIKSSGDLRGIEGGMSRLVDKLRASIEEERADCMIESSRVTKLSFCDDKIGLALNGEHQPSVLAQRVILAI